MKDAATSRGCSLPGLAWPLWLSLVCVNVSLALWVEASGRAALPTDIQTRLLYRTRVEAFFARQAPARAVFAGDSLVYGGHLRARQGARWVEHTLPAQFEQAARQRGQRYSALNLGINGLLFRELDCIVADILARRPELLVIGISPRPYARDFVQAGAEDQRGFLCPAAGHRPRLTALRDGLQDLAYAALPVYRYRDLLQFQLLDTTPRALAGDRLLGQLGRLSTAASEQPDDDFDSEEDRALVAQMMQRIRAAQRLNGVEVEPTNAQGQALHALLRRVRAATSTRTLLFYLREDVDKLAGALDLPRYEAQVQRFVDAVQAQVAQSPRLRFVVLPAQDFAGQYTDHIHLTARGYARLARRLLREVPP